MAGGNGEDINEGAVMGRREGDVGDGEGRPVIQTIDKNSVSVSLASPSSLSHITAVGA